MQNEAYIPPEAIYVAFSEQDTADKLILPYLHAQYGFPSPASLNYQAQHTTPLSGGGSGRYDGLYLDGGYPYAILEAKRYAHDLLTEDVEQARSYCTSSLFDQPVPFFIISNGRDHRFYKLSSTLNPVDGRPHYHQISATPWTSIRSENPGQIRQILHERDLILSLLDFKQQTSRDLTGMFTDQASGLLDTACHPLGKFLHKIIDERHIFIGDSSGKAQSSIRHAIEAISLHFTVKILFIKLIEDLSPGASTPRVIHDLFPRIEYDLIGGLFGFKVLNGLDAQDESTALKLIARSKRFYKRLSRDIAQVSWQDIFRYGFSVHSAQYGKLFKSTNYDRFLPTDVTLSLIHRRLISIDIRFAVLYGSPAERSSVIGRIYEQLIDGELRNSIGAIYTPDLIIDFMVALAKDHTAGVRFQKILEPSCGSGHFYRKIYRIYVDEVFAAQGASGGQRDAQAAHKEALAHVYGRDIDPFAIQLTLLGTFLEQLKDEVLPATIDRQHHIKQWSANKSVDTQNSLDPITIDPDRYFDVRQTKDLSSKISLLESCKRSLEPTIIIGNPPYGVRVVKGVHYDDIYDLASPDSYGYFIANGIKRLKDGGRLVFIVSSSFLTIKTHLQLRELILNTTRIIKVVKLNRATFPGIDIFPVVLELEKCNDPAARADSFYNFFDLWQLHPVDDADELQSAINAILTQASGAPWIAPPTRTAKYLVRQGSIDIFSRRPIFEGRPSIYQFMRDIHPATAPPALSFIGNDEKPYVLRPTEIRERHVCKLASLAEVKIGLQTGDNRRFYRAAEGIIGGAVKGGYVTVDLRNVLSERQLLDLSSEEKENGIAVDDPANDKYFVPLDKTGTADIAAGLLPLFSRPIDFYVDWSRPAVTAMKTHPASVFRNSHLYFREGISYSSTGIYSPTFRLSHGGVFDQKGSCIFSEIIKPRVLLGILSSTLARYFVKAFINHGVDAQLDDLPIVLPTRSEAEVLESLTTQIIQNLQEDWSFDYRPLLEELDAIVFEMYRLDLGEIGEVQTWFSRHYPKLSQY